MATREAHGAGWESAGAPPRAVRVLELRDDGGPVRDGLIEVELGTRLVFSCRPNARIDFATLSIWTNCPLGADDVFHRHSYTCVEGTDEDTVDGDWQAFLDVTQPGAFEFFAEFSRYGDGTAISRSPVHRGRRPSIVTGAAPAAPLPPRSTRDFYVPAPEAARRGPTIRFVVQPELTVRLLRPVEVLPPQTGGGGAAKASPPTVAGTHVDALGAGHGPLPPIDGGGGGTHHSRHRHATPAPQPEGREWLDAEGLVHGYDEATAALLPTWSASRLLSRLGYAPGSSLVHESVRLPLPLEGICLQTQLTRCLGPIDGWLQTYALDHSPTQDAVRTLLPDVTDAAIGVTGTLAEPLACRYNMLHFTPPQRLGGSTSAYSLADQLTLESELFVSNPAVRRALAAAASRMKPTGAVGAAERNQRLWSHPLVEGAKMAVLSRAVDVLERQYGVLSMVDIVLNHTAHNSDWLQMHPEAGYSLRNSPHLRPAFELDEAILRVSRAIETGAVPGVSPRMDSEAAVRAAVDVLQHHATLGLPAVRLWEFYCVDVAGTLAASAALAPAVSIDPDISEALTNADNLEGAGVDADGTQKRLPEPFTRGVMPAVLSEERRHEIAACRHPLVAAAQHTFKEKGYGEGKGPGCIHISDADVERLAAALMRQPPQPSVEESVAKLRGISAQQYAAAMLASPFVGVSGGSNGAVAPGLTEPAAWSSSTRDDDATTMCARSVDAVTSRHGMAASVGSTSTDRSETSASTDSSALLSTVSPQQAMAPQTPLLTPSTVLTSDAVAAPSRSGGAAAAPATAVAGPGHSGRAADATFAFGLPPAPPMTAAAAAIGGVGSSLPPRSATSPADGASHLLPPISVPRVLSPITRDGAAGASPAAGSREAAIWRRTAPSAAAARAPPPYIVRHLATPVATPMLGHDAPTSSGGRSVVPPPSSASPAAAAPAWAGFVSPFVTASLREAADASAREALLADVAVGAVFNDGTGNRFATHVDVERIIAALNTLPGVRIDPMEWTWHAGAGKGAGSSSDGAGVGAAAALATGTGAHAATTSATGSLGLLPSLHLIQRVVQGINLLLYRRYDADMAAALGAVRGTAVYNWLTQWHGVRSITGNRPLVYSYFARVPAAESRASAPITHVLACNGFVWDGNPEIDFTLPTDMAQAYAEVVKAGTQASTYVKRPREWATRHRASRLGLTTVGTGEAARGAGPTRAHGQTDPHAGAAQLRGGDSGTAPFLGAHLLDLSPTVLDAYMRLYDESRFADAEALLVRHALGPHRHHEHSERHDHEPRAAPAPAATASAATAVGVLAASVGSPRDVTAGPTALPPPPIHTAVASGGRAAATAPAARTAAAAAPPLNVLDLDGVPHVRPDAMSLPVLAASTPYMRRDILIWGDCVKLRFGLSPSDSPWLWAHMGRYTRRMAAIFQCFRVDNAHGTPLHVAAAMLDAARHVRRDLYVNAELFTGSLTRDVAYVSRLGINSLVREALQCGSPGEMVRSIYGYGGTPVASLRPSVRGSTAVARLQRLLPAGRRDPVLHRLFASSSGQLATMELLLSGAAAAAAAPATTLLAASSDSRGTAKRGGDSDDLSAMIAAAASRHPTANLSSVSAAMLGSSPLAPHGAPGGGSAVTGGGGGASRGLRMRSGGAIVRAGQTLTTMNGVPLRSLPSPAAVGAAISSPAAPGPGGAGADGSPVRTLLGTGLTPTEAEVRQQHLLLRMQAAAQRLLLHVNEARVSEVLPAPLPALFFDCTHDNPPFHTKRHAVDAVSTAVTTFASVCACGSNRGVDICVPHNISVVTDHRLYSPPDDTSALTRFVAGALGSGLGMAPGMSPPPPSIAPCVGPRANAAVFNVDLSQGLRLIRRRLNMLKADLATRGHTEVFATATPAPSGSEIMTVIRGHPVLSTSYAFITRTAFSRYAGDTRAFTGPLPFVVVEGRVTAVVMAASLRVPHQDVVGEPLVGKHWRYPGANELATLPVPPPTLRPSSPFVMASGTRASLPSDAGAAGGASEEPWVECGTAGGIGTAAGFRSHPRYINGLACSCEFADDTMTDDPSAIASASLGMASLTEIDAEGRPLPPPPSPSPFVDATDGVVLAGAVASLPTTPTAARRRRSRSGDGGAISPMPQPAPSPPVVYTRISLHPDRFYPGSVLVLRLSAPRNVAIRGESSADAAAAAAAAVAGAIPPAADTARVTTSWTMPASPPALADATPAAAAVPVATPGGRTRRSVRALVHAVAFALHGTTTSKPFRSSISGASLSSLVSLDGTGSESGDGGGRIAMLLPHGGAASDGDGDLGLSLGGGAAAEEPAGGTPAPLSARSSTGGSSRGLMPRPRAMRAPGGGRGGSLFYGPPLSELAAALLNDERVTLTTLNRLLYRCEAEELDDSGGGRGLYAVPGAGKLAWAGIAGIVPLLRQCRKWNDMAHPLLENVRRGDWLSDYAVTRLADTPSLARVATWMAGHFAILKTMPPGLKPQGFDRVITAVYQTAVAAVLARMRGPLFPATYSSSQHYLVSVYDALMAAEDDEDGGDGDGEDAPHIGEDGESIEAQADPAGPLPFLTALALTSVQLWGETRSAPLMALPLLEAGPTTAASGGETRLAPAIASLAAGVDHFCTGYMRNWGRDTFIALRGLLLVTGRFDEARCTLLSYASVVRHGLVPNLMDGGRNPRYNCRDAAWWFLQALQDYCAMAPEGTAILEARIRRRFPSDALADYDAEGAYIAGPALVQPLAAVVAEILTRHARGISFREWNAGRRIDAHMKDEGFNVAVHVDPATGFVHGGNPHNCGTWMDKMGEAAAFGTDGVPATPRDGADVEIVALCYSTVHWLAQVHATESARFPQAGVEVWQVGNAAATARWSWAEWAARIRDNFERCFFVPARPDEDGAHVIDSRYVNSRGMYKDSVGSAGGWPDYQLRPNQLVAMAVAPALFDADHADTALSRVERQLMGDAQLGVKTLDPSDWAYRPNYDNNDATDRSTAKGFNYHQGPEWLWPYGYYLRARMHFPPHPCRRVSPESAEGTTAATPWANYTMLRRWVFVRLARHRAHVEVASEGGLPELTNAGGAHCRDSCVSQAWSSATILDALHDLHAVADAYEAADGAAEPDSEDDGEAPEDGEAVDAPIVGDGDALVAAAAAAYGDISVGAGAGVGAGR